jgi:hypothetical protein
LQEQLRRQAEQAVSEAAQVDEAEDEQYGSAHGDELAPQWRSGDRRSRIRAALRDCRPTRNVGRRRRGSSGSNGRTARRSILQRVEEVTAGRRARAGRPPATADRVTAAEGRLAKAREQAAQRQQHWHDKQAAAAAQGQALLGRPPVAVEQHWHVRRARQRLERAQAAQAAQVRTEQAAAAAGAAGVTGACTGEVVAGAQHHRPGQSPDATCNGGCRASTPSSPSPTTRSSLAARLVQTPGDVEQFIPTVAAAQARPADRRCASDGSYAKGRSARSSPTPATCRSRT